MDDALVRPRRGEDHAPSDPGRLWLDKNENSDPDLARLTAEILHALPPSAIYAYPEQDALYRKLAAHVGVETDMLVLTAGSDGAIRAAFEAYVRPGDAVVLTEPTFGMYAVYCQIFGARAVPVDYKPTNRGPRLYTAEMIEAIGREKPRLVCLPNPDSPTGTALTSDEMRLVIEAAGEAGALMLVDEAYYPFYPATVVPWTRDYGHLMVIRTTAKAWGMAGLRVGFAVAPAPVATYLHKVRSMFEINAVGAQVFERMLDHEAAMLASVARLNAGKAAFIAAMTAFGLRNHAGHANFCHVDFGPAADKVHAALVDKVYYRKAFNHPSLAGFTRFTATTPELIQPIIERIRGAVG